MTWTRLSDNWTDRPDIADLDYPERWHYLCLVVMCSRTERWDGILRVIDARRASDHPNPDAAHAVLVKAGFITIDGTRVHVLEVEDHVPPPSARKKSTDRVRRKRAHDDGNHSLCQPRFCPLASRPAGSAIADHPGNSPDIPRPVPSRPGETGSETRFMDDEDIPSPDDDIIDPATGEVMYAIGTESEEPF